jgi:hypothetical protein
VLLLLLLLLLLVLMEVVEVVVVDGGGGGIVVGWVASFFILKYNKVDACSHDEHFNFVLSLSHALTHHTHAVFPSCLSFFFHKMKTEKGIPRLDKLDTEIGHRDTEIGHRDWTPRLDTGHRT